MRALIIASLIATTACTTNYAADLPDAATAQVDAVDAQCGLTLPRCFDLGCAVGALPVDCPRSEDTSVCYCHAQQHPGWCFNR